MSSAVAPIPDWAIAWLDLIDEKMADRLPVGSSTEAPTPGTDPLPAAQAYIVDGRADQTEGYAVVDVHFFAANYADASRLSRDFDGDAMGYPHVVRSSSGSAVLFDRVECLATPAEIPFTDDNSVKRFRATYSVSYRRR